MKRAWVIILVIFTSMAKAQTITKFSIDSRGQSIFTENRLILYIIGEVNI